MTVHRVLFVGLGGAGQRHLRILRALLPEQTRFSAYRRTGRTPVLKPDFTVDDGRSVEEAFGVRMFVSLAEAFANGPDLTVISTPTAFHREPLMMALECGSAMIVEKPWAESLDGFREFAAGVRAKQLPFLCSFQRRFHPLIRRAREAIAAGAIGRPMSAEFTVYSHVPSWHPYEDWRDLYAVMPDLGGGVLLTEIHELDLAHWFFGLPQAVFCRGGNWSGHQLAVEDTAQLTLVYPRLSVTITLCFMHQPPARRFHVAGTDGDVTWDADGNSLRVTTRQGPPEILADPSLGNDAMFVAQAEQFLASWTPADTDEALDAAAGSLAIVEAAKRSMATGLAEPVDGSLMAVRHQDR